MAAEISLLHSGLSCFVNENDMSLYLGLIVIPHLIANKCTVGLKSVHTPVKLALLMWDC